MFEGLTVAMVTPFRAGALDLEATARLVDFMIDGGVQGLVVSGSTGEAARKEVRLATMAKVPANCKTKCCHPGS